MVLLRRRFAIKILRILYIFQIIILQLLKILFLLLRRVILQLDIPRTPRQQPLLQLHTAVRFQNTQILLIIIIFQKSLLKILLIRHRIEPRIHFRKIHILRRRALFPIPIFVQKTLVILALTRSVFPHTIIVIHAVKRIVRTPKLHQILHLRFIEILLIRKL